MAFDPDFIITINGDNVTRFVNAWKLTDSEKKSTLLVVLKNPDQILSDKYDVGQELTLVFGYTGNTGEVVVMNIKQYEEAYSIEASHDFIRVTGVDCLDATEGDSHASGGQDTTDKLPERSK